MDYFQAPDLGACCACGKTDASVRNIVALDRLAPQPGTGWGCVICNLPANGAIVVLCDACRQHANPPLYACDGYAADKKRIPLNELPAGEFRHDYSLHKTKTTLVEYSIIHRSHHIPQRQNSPYRALHGKNRGRV